MIWVSTVVYKMKKFKILYQECIFVYQVILCNSTAALVVVNNIYFFNFQDVLTFY